MPALFRRRIASSVLLPPTIAVITGFLPLYAFFIPSASSIGSHTAVSQYRTMMEWMLGLSCAISRARTYMGESAIPVMSTGFLKDPKGGITVLKDARSGPE